MNIPFNFLLGLFEKLIFPKAKPVTPTINLGPFPEKEKLTQVTLAPPRIIIVGPDASKSRLDSIVLSRTLETPATMPTLRQAMNGAQNQDRESIRLTMKRRPPPPK